MKKVLLSLALLLCVFFAHAQQALIAHQSSCQPVLVIFYADVPGGCGTPFYSTMHFVPAGTNVYFDMYGGPNPINWTVPPPPGGADFTAIKVIDPGMAWGNAVFTPCLGPQTFPPQGPCGLRASSSWSPSSLVVVKVF